MNSLSPGPSDRLSAGLTVFRGIGCFFFPDDDEDDDDAAAAGSDFTGVFLTGDLDGLTDTAAEKDTDFGDDETDEVLLLLMLPVAGLLITAAIAAAAPAGRSPADRFFFFFPTGVPFDCCPFDACDPPDDETVSAEDRFLLEVEAAADFPVGVE
jgi:hypothetical protein